jgi:hypothetical protein
MREDLYLKKAGPGNFHESGVDKLHGGRDGLGGDPRFGEESGLGCMLAAAVLDCPTLQLRASAHI